VHRIIAIAKLYKLNHKRYIDNNNKSSFVCVSERVSVFIYLNKMDPQELIERSAEERRKIFERYEMGRNAEIDPWEDPEYNVYSLIDR
jgi:hypothetical protein